MRIQYRVRASGRVTWSDWHDWASGSVAQSGTRSAIAPTEWQTRIVDDNGDVVTQTVAFIPGYYESPESKHLYWISERPTGQAATWKRRDDVKPSAAQ